MAARRTACPGALPDLGGRTVLVTGGNSGIGKEAAVGLASLDATVVIAVRDPARGAAACAEIRERSGSDRVEAMDLDLASLASVRAFARAFLNRHPRLDVLVNNAGVVQAQRGETEDGFETTFQVNHLAPFLLTALLVDRLVASAPARVVTVASASHRQAGRLDLDDLQSEQGRYAGLAVYARTKLANILFARELARRLEGTGVTATCLHPGTIRTGWGMDGDSRGLLRLGLALARPFFASPARGARTILHLAAAPAVEGSTGGYYVRCREQRPSAGARDDAVARRLWEVSEALLGSTRFVV